MNTKIEKTDPSEALEILEQACAYYTPEAQTIEEREPELFEYANAA